jgi:hypothetical protein
VTEPREQRCYICGEHLGDPHAKGCSRANPRVPDDKVYLVDVPSKDGGGSGLR